jgi:ribosomal peptide maturation radical SAM protein 1
MRLTLVTMPWASLDCTSVAIGTLVRAVERTASHTDVAEWYGNIEWAEWLLDVSEGQVTPSDYEKLAGAAYFEGVGDWVFTSALHRSPGWREDDYVTYLRQHGFDPALPLYLHRQAEAFIEDQVVKVMATRPDVLGFTTTFLQNVASLSLASRIRERLPDIPIVFGGGNCDGPQGQALMRNFPFIDYTVSGEGEDALVALLDYLNGDMPDLERVPNLVHRGEGTPKKNKRVTTFGMRATAPPPNFDGYFKRLGASEVLAWIEPKLVLEGARGCWWGEKHQCTFCGLNGSSIKFTSKPAHVLWTEIQELVARHQVLDLIMVDNIIDMTYFKDLLPQMAASDLDLRVHYEIKSNIQGDHARALREAGIVHVQPGIESLSSRVLGLMDKGVTGVHNIRCLRECERNGLTVSWNYLYGFPGEKDDDYGAIIEQFPALEHLQPPGGVTRIALERFSPYFEDASLGFADRWPADVYEYIYDLPEQELMDLVYLFGTPDQGIGGEIEARLHAACQEWTDAYLHGSLVSERLGESIRVVDSRPSWGPRELTVTGITADILEIVNSGKTVAATVRALAQRRMAVPEECAGRELADLKSAGLVFEDSGQFIALPIPLESSVVRS